MSTFDALIEDLTRDANRAQPKDALQFCANWCQSRLEEQRTRTRDSLAERSTSFSRDVPTDLYYDNPLGAGASVSPFTHSISRPRSSMRESISPSPFGASPFGTLNIPGNALLYDSSDLNTPVRSTYTMDMRDIPPTSPHTMNALGSYPGFSADGPSPLQSFGGSANNPGDYLHPPTAAIFARRTSVSAESIVVDSTTDEPLPVHPKSPAQLVRIKAAIANNFIFRDLDEEQETGVLAAMQERPVAAGEVVIRQGDVGEYFYVVEHGLLHCFIRPEPLPPAWLTDAPAPTPAEETFVQPGYHPEFGRKVAECAPGTSFGELALMYGHPRAATVLAVERATLWALDRITFRTIILKAAHRRRTMYEQFLAGVDLLASLQPEERSKVADALVSTTYADGEAVVRQGEMGDTFFFVEEGEARVTKTEDGREVEVGLLKKGNYFGELSLLRRAPRAATVSAVVRTGTSAPKLKVAALDAPAFTRLLGPLREIMERKAGERYGSPGTPTQ
ncbi:hypothetical protein HWV62_32756 [Athelia sp. TMB]|nr:hypothetical protein HWV62_32756 [Athelia sp. TMB]